MLELLDEVLTDAGFGVRAVSDLAEIEQHLADPRFDVVLCDELSGELDGLMIFDALVESVSAERPGFILLGDSPDGERIAKCLARDMEEYVVKPFDVSELVARIRKVVRLSELLVEAATKAAEAAEASAAAAADSEVASEEGDEKVGFQGDLQFMNLPDLLMNLHQNGQTGRLLVVTGEGEYAFAFAKGELVNTKGPRGLKNRKAFYRAMRETGGTFQFMAAEHVSGRRSSAFENLANAILQAVQEADEYPLTRRKLPPDPVAVSLTTKVEETPLPENSAIQPLLEGLIKSTTIDILIHACPKTDLEAAKELEDLMMAEVLIQSGDAAAERAS